MPIDLDFNPLRNFRARAGAAANPKHLMETINGYDISG